MKIVIPDDLERVIDSAWRIARWIPGYLSETEARFLGMAAACVPTGGMILEIGSYKGRSTVMLATIAKHYGLAPVVAIDPHNFNSGELRSQRTSENSSSYLEFMKNIQDSGLLGWVNIQRAYSTEVSHNWKHPIGLLWIDGDHGYAAVKSDFEGFFPHLLPQGVVAFHDALHEFEGPLRIFSEQVLHSEHFGAAGFTGSIAWSQYRPDDGHLFHARRRHLSRNTRRLVRSLQHLPLRGVKKLLYKLDRFRIPHLLLPITQWAELLNRPGDNASGPIRIESSRQAEDLELKK